MIKKKIIWSKSDFFWNRAVLCYFVVSEACHSSVQDLNHHAHSSSLFLWLPTMNLFWNGLGGTPFSVTPINPVLVHLKVLTLLSNNTSLGSHHYLLCVSVRLSMTSSSRFGWIVLKNLPISMVHDSFTGGAVGGFEDVLVMAMVMHLFG